MSEAQSVKKFNNYITVPRRLHGGTGQFFTPKTRLVGGLISSYSGKKDTGGNVSVCYRTFNTIAEQLNCSTVTAWRSLHTLEDAQLVNKERPGAYVFERSEYDEKNFDRIPALLLTKEFEIVLKHRNGNITRITRRLTSVECIVAGHVLTRCDNAKTRDNAYNKDTRGIAKALGLSYPAVKNALRVLKGAKIIVQRADEKACNGHKKHIFHISRQFLHNIRRAEQAAEQAQKRAENAPQLKTGRDVQEAKTLEDAARAARERWYYDRRHVAEHRAERNFETACQDAAFNTARRALSELNIKLAFAEINGEPEIAELTQQIKQQEAARRAALVRIGFTDNDLTPQYHCTKCNDTGFIVGGRSDGFACDCYYNRGAPPGQKKNTRTKSTK